MTPESYGIRPPGNRLPPETRLGAVRVQVANLRRSVDFYVDVLGLRVLDHGGARVTLGPAAPHEGDDPTDPEAEAGSDEPIIELREQAGARPVRPRSRLGLFHFAVLLPDRPALGRFVGHLSRLGIEVGAADHGVSEALYLQDPDGLGIEVYADRPRREWRHRDRELLMGTDPLDLADLRAAAGDAPWSGAPAGTAVGHVHLHVGELDRAAHFYHVGLGLDKVVWSYPGALFLSAGGYHHHLGLNTWAGQAPPAGEDEARLLEWTVVLPGAGAVGDVVASLEAAGYHVERTGSPGEPGGEGSGGAGRTLGDGVVARDPWGTAVRVLTE